MVKCMYNPHEAKNMVDCPWECAFSRHEIQSWLLSAVGHTWPGSFTQLQGIDLVSPSKREMCLKEAKILHVLWEDTEQVLSLWKFAPESLDPATSSAGQNSDWECRLRVFACKMGRVVPTLWWNKILNGQHIIWTPYSCIHLWIAKINQSWFKKCMKLAQHRTIPS